MIPNDRLLQMGDAEVSLMDAFRSADEVLLNGVQGITDLITTPGLINVDFADVKGIMSGASDLRRPDAVLGAGLVAGTAIIDWHNDTATLDGAIDPVDGPIDPILPHAAS